AREGVRTVPECRRKLPAPHRGPRRRIRSYNTSVIHRLRLEYMLENFTSAACRSCAFAAYRMAAIEAATGHGLAAGLGVVVERQPDPAGRRAQPGTVPARRSAGPAAAVDP